MWNDYFNLQVNLIVRDNLLFIDMNTYRYKYIYKNIIVNILYLFIKKNSFFQLHFENYSTIFIYENREKKITIHNPTKSNELNPKTVEPPLKNHSHEPTPNP